MHTVDTFYHTAENRPEILRGLPFNEVPLSLIEGEERAFRFTYGLTHRGHIFYVGDSADPKERFSSHKYDAIHLDRSATEGTKYMRDVLLQREHMACGMVILEVIAVKDGENGSKATPDSKISEREWIKTLYELGEPIVNKEVRKFKGVA